MSRLLAFLACKLAISAVDAKEPHSAAAKATFMRENLCPAAGERKGSCPGYVIDHIEPLCASDEDHKRSMQWQTVSDVKENDKAEWAQGRALREVSQQTWQGNDTANP